MQIVLDTRGLHFSVRNKCFFIELESDSRIIHPSKISSILITAPCRISSPALILAAQSEIPVIICNNSGKPEARVWSSLFINISSLRRKQYVFSNNNKAMIWAYEIICLKIEAQLNNMQFVATRKTSLSDELLKAIKEINEQQTIFDLKFHSENNQFLKKELLFLEAFVASRYWQLIGKRLPIPFYFTNRVKRNAGDLFNICINYLYGMLRNQVETSVLCIGLDPALGIIHRDGYKMPSLVFDLMEPFRPITDRMLLVAIVNKEFTEEMTETEEMVIKLTKNGRKKLIQLFNDNLQKRIKYKGNVSTLRNHILTEVKLLSEKIKQA